MSPVAAVLVGMPGTGKTSVGRKLADTLGVRFADSDELVVQREGRPVAEIFASLGEEYFRRVEAEVIAQALAEFDGVLALGGGAITTKQTRDVLMAAQVPVVLLQTGISTLTSRVGTAADRPLLADDPEIKLTELANRRGEWYRQVATVTVDTERRSVGRVVDVVTKLITDEPGNLTDADADADGSTEQDTTRS